MSANYNRKLFEGKLDSMKNGRKGLGERKFETKGKNGEINFVYKSQELVNTKITITLTFIMILGQFLNFSTPGSLQPNY